MIKVFLREKKLKHGKRGLYLDFYPPIVHPETRRPTRREHLRLYVYERPRIEAEKEHNKETRALAENLRARRQIDLQSGYYGFLTARDNRRSAVAFIEDFVTAKKQTSQSNYENYNSVLKYFTEFAGNAVVFADLTEHFCADFRAFLLTRDRLSNNTAASYFDKFKYIIRSAFEQKLLRENPAQNIKSIKVEDTQREFLTLDELQTLAATAFPEYDALRRAALFAALTGLRFCDIEKLTWQEIHDRTQSGASLRFRQKKTKDTETLPINDAARELLGTRVESPDAKVFPALKYSQCAHLSLWTNRAGIERKITFHCFRHTHATLQLSLGTDIYTIQKLLGHKNLKTTQIYARIVDEKKREAADKITLK